MGAGVTQTLPRESTEPCSPAALQPCSPAALQRALLEGP